MSSNQIAIQVKNLSKCYEIYKQPQDRLKQSIIPRLRVLAGKPPKNYYHEFWALRDVSFDVKKGETVGIIGRNGSGKSTLLQLICGTLTPTSGTVVTSGRIAALLELGSGFNPEFSGRENVYLNGAILGLSQEEIDSRFDDIAAFADVGEFIDQAVKTYSSGMLVRLAFSVNVMSQPEIMIVDEALAVGDMNFQSKCMTALKRKQESGTTVLYVSHDVGSVKSLCSRGIHLEHGQVKNIGIAADVAAGYIRMMREEMNENQRMVREKLNDDQQSLNSVFQSVSKIQENSEATSQPLQPWALKTSEEFDHRVSQFRYGTGEARITFVELLNTNDEPTNMVEFNQKVKIRIFFEAHEQKTLSVNFAVMDDKKNNITGSNLRLVDQPYLIVRSGDRFQVDYSIQLPLTEGIYSIQTSLTEPIIADQTANFIDVIDDAVVFTVSRWMKARLWHRVFLFPSVEIKTKSQEHNPAQHL